MLPLFERASAFAGRTAIIDADGAHDYTELLDGSGRIATGLAGRGERIVFLVAPDARYVKTLWGIWRAGATAVPLCIAHPPAEWEHILEDAAPAAVIADAHYAAAIAPLAEQRDIPLLEYDQLFRTDATPLPDVSPEAPALMVYTSGTTGRPKGAVCTHANLEAQITALVEAWGWSAEDRTLNVLPLHHVHGIVNIVCCALWSGASLRMAPLFDADAVWRVIADADLTLFMAVPTIYAKLITHWRVQDAQTQAAWSAACRAMSLFVSGSAALPVPLFEAWRQVSGHEMLERYGMTEIGMALSNPLDGERRPGTVGRPLPRVEVRLTDEGEIQVRGPAVFSGYWNRPQATAEAFSADGWFRTGDIAVVEDGYYRILGRASVDIIKTGGYKVSALEIEQVLLRHPSIVEVAVVGVPDPVWGERVAAAIVGKPGADITPGWLRGWAKQYLADYKVPTLLLKLDSLPRNLMGKVDKKAVMRGFEGGER